jgi:hypothetical protein
MHDGQTNFALHPNDNAREARPSWWIFQGSSMGFLVVGVLFFVTLCMLLSRSGVEWWMTILISSIPLAIITAFTHWFINGRSPSFAMDLMQFQMFKVQEFLFLSGAISIPPQLWKPSPKPAHPDNYK